jgi:hypothetical protein
MSALSQKASEPVGKTPFIVAIPNPVSSSEPMDLKSEECEISSVKSSKKLPSGKQLIQKLNEKCKHLNPYEYNM